MAFSYTAYGLRLSSERELPGLKPSASPLAADVAIGWRTGNDFDSTRFCLGAPSCAYAAIPGLCFRMAPDGGEYQFLYTDGPDFVVGNQGGRVWVHVPPGISDVTVATYLLGPVLGFVLRLRRMLCLHASAIATGMSALAFVGPAGSGKSTLAAAFTAHGCAILADDKVVLSGSNGAFLAQPGFPRLRLWPDAADAFFGHHVDLPRILPEDPTFDKRYLDLSHLPGGFAAEPLPLAGLFILGARAADSRQAGIRAVHPHPALIGLAAHTYMNYLADGASRAWEFDALARVVASVPAFLVTPPEHSFDLPQLCAAILSVGNQLAAASPQPNQYAAP